MGAGVPLGPIVPAVPLGPWTQWVAVVEWAELVNDVYIMQFCDKFKNPVHVASEKAVGDTAVAPPIDKKLWWRLRADRRVRDDIAVGIVPVSLLESR